ncbi:hypothetical protein EDD75_0393 [Thermodesulfitimonas autotrophica]|uniref:Uncharacterized protein n=1 Tax=Thermodesulfitimonas autotrophica TaxID=1894989 RepID=A0A3N5AWG9_9THEO|nr:hypothetical protein [Thermodesulfitimonas autotrophica]RPF49576.1 hypothetical protein EDD75_0393 [Thermodesulfitimonas autotrophica]
MKRILSLIVLSVFCLALGFGSGWFGARQHYVVAPRKKAQEMAKKHQEELNKMVRRGKVVSVEPDAITVKVEKGGEAGRTVTYRTNEFTSVQVGMGFVNQPGQKVDLTKHFKPGDYVDLLVKDGQALALHRDFRPEERPAPPEGVPGQVYGPQVRLAPNVAPQK